MRAETATSDVNTIYNNTHRPALRSLALVAIVSAALLAGCASNTRAPITDLSTGTPAPATSHASTYRVQAGDTLYKIASANNMDVAELARLNNIGNSNVLRVGQELRLNASGPAPSTPAPDTGTATPLPVTPVKQAEPTATVRASDSNLLVWGWPASGDIIQGFNTNTKGIDISGTTGDPIYAAADGNVMYAGNGVRGLGNLILLGHSDGFVTAYAHNDKLLVKTGQKVKKGDKIAALGQTDTSSPRLHFEIRRRGTPVNPLSYLPTR